MYHLFHLKVEILSALKIVLYRKGGLRHETYGTMFNMVPETTRCSKLHLNNVCSSLITEKDHLNS